MIQNILFTQTRPITLTQYSCVAFHGLEFSVDALFKHFLGYIVFVDLINKKQSENMTFQIFSLSVTISMLQFCQKLFSFQPVLSH